MGEEGFDPVRRFAALARQPDEQLDLAEGALAIAAGGDPALEPEVWLRELDRLAQGIDDVDGLLSRLFRELGFRGNSDDYYDPDNSFLHKVIQRRIGIPITLAVLLIAVGRRAGLELQGIGMPGHFLVRDAASGTYMDPFNQGEVVDERTRELLFRAATGAGPEVAFGPHLLPVAGTSEILARMLANLKEAYRRRGAHADLEWVLRMRLALPQVPPVEAIELGQALAAQGRLLDAAKELESRAQGAQAEASAVLQTQARALRARLN